MDRFIWGLSLLEVLQREEGKVGLLAKCGLAAYGFFPALTLGEVWVVFAVFHHVLKQPGVEQCIFWTLALRNEHVPMSACLRSVGAYGVRELVKVLQSWHRVRVWGYSLVYALGCAAAEYYLITREFSVNARRKLFHLGLFGYLAVFPASVVRVQAVGCLAVLLGLPRVLKLVGVSERRLLAAFLSEKDRRGAVSHLLLLGGCFFALELLGSEREKFLFVISAVCIVDTVASWFPNQVSKKRYKTLTGSMTGAVCAKAVLCCLGVEYPLYMFLSLGLTEYLTQMNDNLSLPIVGYLLVANYPHLKAGGGGGK